jgi:hypothetical protein
MLGAADFCCDFELKALRLNYVGGPKFSHRYTDCCNWTGDGHGFHTGANTTNLETTTITTTPAL